MAVHEWRKRTATGMVATAVAIGLREALEEPKHDDPPIVIDASGDPLDPEALEVNLFPDHPELSWVVVRPWLKDSDRS